jgi:hypothetical protein
MRAGNPAERQNTMEKTLKHEDFERMLAEADDLLNRIDAEIVEFVEEGKRAQLEQQAQRLKKLKSAVQDKIEKEEPSQNVSYSDGVHEAMDDIVKAMKALASFLS